VTRRLVAVFLLCLSAATASADDAAYTLELIDARPESGFNYPYYLRVPARGPDGLPNVLVVESNNSGVQDELQQHIEATRAQVTGNGLGPLVAGSLDQPLLVPVFPRSREHWQVYTHALDRDTLLLQGEAAERLDLQLLRMVAHARERLAADGIAVQEKFVLVGFSASGTFANRFAFLHPERLLAVVSGAVNAFPMLPLDSMDDSALPFPLGTADIQTLTGRSFQRASWRGLPQLIFMGAEDDNDALQYDDAYSDAERETVFALLGEPMAERWSAAQRVYLKAGPNVTFATYGQVGHWTDRRINRDVVNFVRTEIERAAAKQGQ